MAFTYFFRDTHSVEIAIEYLLKYTSGNSSIKIWDAGCASGQEPYSLAILLAEKMSTFMFRNVSIQATDIDTSDLFEKIIKNGVYPKDELQRIPSELFEKYFEESEYPNSYQINYRIRDKIKFSKHNLLSLKEVDNGFHLIVCKNVLLHFQPEERVEVFKMYHRALAENGLLVMEHTQDLSPEVSNLFERVIGNVQLYRKI
ncbi:chemotaxis protein CheR [bacterium]|nr:chemotaxis protein CheR [bacterium]